MDNPEKIKCPIFTVWIIFILNIFWIDSQFFNDYYGNIRYRVYSIFSIILIIIILIDLIGCIFVTISFENNKYSFYLTGLIMTTIFNVLMTITATILFFGRYFLIFIIIQILADWSQLVVLLVYNKRVKSSFKNSHLNDNLIKEFPKEAQPLRQTKEQIEAEEKDQDIYI